MTILILKQNTCFALACCKLHHPWRCCYPSTGKPADDFNIDGFGRNHAVCSSGGKIAEVVGGDQHKCWQEYCNDRNKLRPRLIRDLEEALRRHWPLVNPCNGFKDRMSSNDTELWGQEWWKHGTCSGLDQHAYFEAAVRFLTAVLASAGPSWCFNVSLLPPSTIISTSMYF